MVFWCAFGAGAAKLRSAPGAHTKTSRLGISRHRAAAPSGARVLNTFFSFFFLLPPHRCVWSRVSTGLCCPCLARLVCGAGCPILLLSSIIIIIIKRLAPPPPPPPSTSSALRFQQFAFFTILASRVPSQAAAPECFASTKDFDVKLWCAARCVRRLRHTGIGARWSEKVFDVSARTSSGWLGVM